MGKHLTGHAIDTTRAALFSLILVLVLSGCTKVETHMSLGTLERDRITLSATAAEIITSQPISEGEQVKVGDLLVQLDTTLQNLAINKIKAEIVQQEARLEELRNGPRPEEILAAQAKVETAEANRKESEQDLNRIRDLVSRRVSAQADLDTALTRLESNTARLRDSQAQLQLLRSGTRIEAINQAVAQITITEAILASEQQKLSNLSIRATRDGTLNSLPFNVGERVALGAQLAVLLDNAPPYARVYIPETSRSDINNDDKLTVHVDGSENTFVGVVRWISLEPAFTPYYALNSAERSRLVYLAEIQLSEDATHLPSGLPAQVELP